MPDFTVSANIDTFMQSANYAAARTALNVPSFAETLLALTGVATLAAGALLYGTGTSTPATLAAGTAGTVLQANGAAAPSWVSSLTLTNGFNATMTRNAVVDLDYGNYYLWTIGSVPAGSFPLLGVYKIVNNSVTATNPGDHSVSLISLAEDAPGCSLLMLAGESRVNARGIAQYVAHNSKWTYQQFSTQLPQSNGATSAAHWADVSLMQADNVTALTTSGLFANAYLTTAIVGGDPLLRHSLLASNRIYTTDTTAAHATAGFGGTPDGAIKAPNGGIHCGLNLVVGGGASFGDIVTLAKSTNSILYSSVLNTNAGTGAAATVACQNNAGTTAYFGVGSTTFTTIPGTANKAFIYAPGGMSITDALGTCTVSVDRVLFSQGTMGAAPAVFRAGAVRSAAAVVLIGTSYLEIESGGTVYKVGLVT